MNPIEKQNRINPQSRPWHLRLSAVLGSIRRGIVWWFTGDVRDVRTVRGEDATEDEAPWLQEARALLERCWQVEMQSVDLLGVDQREW